MLRNEENVPKFVIASWSGQSDPYDFAFTILGVRLILTEHNNSL